LDLLAVRSDACFKLLMEMNGGGQAAVANYFNALGAGHMTWLSRTHGNLWRYRNGGNPPPPQKKKVGFREDSKDIKMERKGTRHLP
jgi:hypothetical protein